MLLYLIMYMLLTSVVIFILLIYVKMIRNQKRIYNRFIEQKVPAEPFIPICGQLFDIKRATKQDNGLEYFNELAKKHGYYYLFHVGPFARFVVAEPELLADILSRSKTGYYKKTAILINIVKPVIGIHNLLVSDYDEHERARKMLNPAFHSLNLRSMVSIMSNETAKTIDHLLSQISVTNQIRIDTECNALTLSIIMSSAFGQNFDIAQGTKENVCQIFNDLKEILEYRTLHMINQIQFLDELPFWGKASLIRMKQKLDEFVGQTIADRRNGNTSSLCSGQDILDLLLSAVDDQGEKFTDEQIKDEAVTFVFAGHETTSNLVTWALYALMTNDDALNACQEEVDRVLPNRTVPTYEHLSDLQAIEAVLYETLRLYPSAPVFGRQSVKDHTISSSDGKTKIHIPADTMIVVNNYVLHRREDYWPRPLEFNYKRWVRDPITGLKPKLAHPYAYLPFAAGTRNCIGQNFALLEAKIILAMFVQRFTFKLVPNQKIVFELKGLTMPPKYGMYIYLKNRE